MQCLLCEVITCCVKLLQQKPAEITPEGLRATSNLSHVTAALGIASQARGSAGWYHSETDEHLISP